MRQLKKVAALAMVATMAASSFVACGSDDKSSTPAAPSTDAPKTEATNAPTTDAPATDEQRVEVPADTGKVLNIYCWNDEYARRMRDHMPGYTANDAEDALKGGKIGDVEVKFVQAPSEDMAYQNLLDAALMEQADADADEKVDIFLVEADYALKYVDTPYTMNVKDLGIISADIADQYKYTQDIVTDSEGVLKGLSWQGCPGIMFYNRDIAKDVLGSDDPDTVQAAVKDWATYKETAKKVVDKGYLMQPSVNDTYRVYSNNVSTAWVTDGKISVDANIKAWVDDAKELFDMDATTNDDLWGGYANATNGGCFAAFGPAWLINFCFGFNEQNADSKNVAEAGKWGGVVGPQSFYWGGTWLCAAAGTDNANLVREIMLTMTTDKAVLKEIVEKDDDFCNSVSLMKEMADSDYSSYILGGQNPLGMYAAGAEKISLDTLCPYDQSCNESFQSAMKDYFAGNSTYDEALAGFYQAVETANAELSH